MKNKTLQHTKKEINLGFGALIYSFILLLVLINSFATESPLWHFFYFFTYQSNIIILAWFLLFGIGSFVGGWARKITHNNIVQIAVTVYISITFLIVAFVLNPVYKGKYSEQLNTYAHFFSAIVMWIYFFAVEGSGKLKYRHALYILIYPLVYFFAIEIIGALVKVEKDGKIVWDYPYDFVNPNIYPNYIIFALVIIGLIIFFACFGLLLIKFKKYLIKNYYTKEDALFEKNTSGVLNTTSNSCTKQKVDLKRIEIKEINSDTIDVIDTSGDESK